MADQHAATAELDEHRRRDLARVRAGGLVVAVLRAEADGRALQDLADGHQRGVRRAEDDVDALEALEPVAHAGGERDRKSTRLNSSHEWISYAVFCLKKKKKKVQPYNNKRRT